MKYFLNARLIIFSVVLLVVTSCKKEGPGGRANIHGVVAHHGLPIPNATVYIKYGATEFPGTDVAEYDDQVTADATGKYEFSNLVKGDYYLFATGYDAAILENVKGGVYVKVKRNEHKEAEIPVTE